MKKQIHVGVVRTLSGIADAQRVRNQVFVQEKALLREAASMFDREVDAYDDLETTIHFVAYADGDPVGAVRLVRPNADVARAIGQPIGIDLATRYDLGPFAITGVSLAEVSRFCVLPAHRGSAVLGELYLAMFHESVRVGMTHWVGAGNAETDALEDAEIAYRIARRDGLVSPRWRVSPRPGASAEGPSTRRLYSEEERARAGKGDLEGLGFPRTLKTFAGLAARYIGPPIRERGYTVCSLPLVVDMADVKHTRAFKRSAEHS